MHADNVVCNNSKTLEIISEYKDNVQPKCKNCGKSFALLLSHLLRSKKCQIGYDIEMMKKERDQEKSKKDTLLKHHWRQQKQASDSQSYKESMAGEKSRQRAEKRMSNELQFKKKMAAEKSRERVTREGFKKK